MKIGIDTKASGRVASPLKLGGLTQTNPIGALATGENTDTTDLRIGTTGIRYLLQVAGLKTISGTTETERFLGGKKEGFGKMVNGFLPMWQT